MLRPSILTLALLSASAACVDYAKPSVAAYEAGNFAEAARIADAALASHPDDDNLWNAKIRAALAQGDEAALATAYAGYAQHRGELDKPLLHDLVNATLDQALDSPSAKLKIAAIDAVEDIQIEALAEHVHDQLGSDDDRVVAAAAV